MLERLAGTADSEIPIEKTRRTPLVALGLPCNPRASELLIRLVASSSPFWDRYDCKPAGTETPTDPGGIAFGIRSAVENNSHEAVVRKDGAKLPIHFVLVSSDHDQPSRPGPRARLPLSSHAGGLGTIEP
jgi:hypothetical protein